MNDMPKTNSLNRAYVQPMSYTQAQNVNDNKPSDDKKMKKSTKLMIGASALAAVVLAGVMIRKGCAAKNTASEAMNEVANGAENLASKVEALKNSVSGLLAAHASEAELAAKLDEIGKLPLQEQLKAYESLDRIKLNITKLQRIKKNGKNLDEIVLRRGMKGVPQDVQEEMTNGNWIKAGELYEAHVQELPITHKVEYTGATLEETIKNAREESRVKPHTYNIENEGEIVIFRNNQARGYSSDVVTKDGLMYEGEYESRGLLPTVPDNYDVIKNGEVRIAHGVSPKTGKYEVQMTLPDKGTNGSNDEFSFCLLSAGAEMSPAQKDMLALAENPEKVDIDLFRYLAHESRAYDMDLILSAIQTTAKI